MHTSEYKTQKCATGNASKQLLIYDNIIKYNGTIVHAHWFVHSYNKNAINSQNYIINSYNRKKNQTPRDYWQKLINRMSNLWSNKCVTRSLQDLKLVS